MIQDLIMARLKIELRGSRENPFFLVRNRGLMQVIEIRAKLLKIDTSQTHTREILQLRVPERDYLLFQVIARHGFTNFTRLHIKRVYGPELDSLKRSG
jgi:hypothetical protein